MGYWDCGTGLEKELRGSSTAIMGLSKDGEFRFDRNLLVKYVECRDDECRAEKYETRFLLRMDMEEQCLRKASILDGRQ